MIIRYPTGLYGLSDNDLNVTWHISNNDPPRSNLVTIKIPTSEEVRQIPPLTYDGETRRKTFGELIYTINESNDRIAGSGTKALGEGDILDFPEETEETEISIPRNNRIERRHDLNVLDLVSAGLDEDEIGDFYKSVNVKKQQLDQEFALIRAQISSMETGIKEIQKKINETTKVIKAVSVLEDEELLDKIIKRKQEYELINSKLIEEHEIKTKELEDVVDQTNEIDTVLK